MIMIMFILHLKDKNQAEGEDLTTLLPVKSVDWNFGCYQVSHFEVWDTSMFVLGDKMLF